MKRQVSTPSTYRNRLFLRSKLMSRGEHLMSGVITGGLFWGFWCVRPFINPSTWAKEGSSNFESEDVEVAIFAGPHLFSLSVGFFPPLLLICAAKVRADEELWDRRGLPHSCCSSPFFCFFFLFSPSGLPSPGSTLWFSHDAAMSNIFGEPRVEGVQSVYGGPVLGWILDSLSPPPPLPLSRFCFSVQ